MLSKKEKLKELLVFKCSHCEGVFRLDNGRYELNIYNAANEKIEEHIFCSADDVVSWFEENRPLFLLKSMIDKSGNQS